MTVSEAIERSLHGRLNGVNQAIKIAESIMSIAQDMGYKDEKIDIPEIYVDEFIRHFNSQGFTHEVDRFGQHYRDGRLIIRIKIMWP